MHTSLNYCTLVTAHHDDGQKWPKHVRAMNCENIYHLYIQLVFITKYSIALLVTQ